MSENKKYYWLKLKETFFQDEDIKLILSQKDGSRYVIFWMKLLLKSVGKDVPGLLRYKETMPYTPDMLASITDTNASVVQAALNLFIKLGMLEIKEDGTIWIEEANKLVGSESKSADRVRKFRKNKQLKALQCNDDVTNETHNVTSDVTNETHNVTQRLEYRVKSKELDKEKEIYKEKVKPKTNDPPKKCYSEFHNVFLTEVEYQKLKNKYGEDETGNLVDRLGEYIASKGKKYHSHYATILSWERREKHGGNQSNHFNCTGGIKPPKGKYADIKTY